MARGVARAFFRILEGEQKALGWRAKVLAIAAALLLPVAALAAFPLGLLVYLTSLVLGLIGGLARGRWLYGHHYQLGLQAAWREWMHAADGSETLAECNRKVRGISGRNVALRGGLTLAAFGIINAGLVMFALQNLSGLVHVAPVAALNGLALGWFVARDLVGHRWAAQLHAATKELVTSGELGTWGTK